ncbi:hypothetical protein CGK32_22750 [Vibrio parahaemolyticus]|uniref:hypothetical protein n=1 Tax=Vibrio parahaemolyticus TaxID=670 RepID=UPI001122B957|nr:hypothetical protein [Vibrio parahaemolyticus]TOA18436.1 hypothetical protein CGK32_22750 [Vibrio parahaemolyticus]
MRITKRDVPQELRKDFQVVYDLITDGASASITNDIVFASDRKLVPFLLLMIGEVDDAIDEFEEIIRGLEDA